MGVENSKGWCETTIGEICLTASGGTPSRKNSSYFTGPIPWVKSGELNHGIIKETEEQISQEALENSSAKLKSRGTLLIALYGATVGKLGFLGVDAATNQAVASISCFGGISNRLIFYYLFHKKEDLLKKRIGGAQPNISQTILNEVEVPLPPLNEQHRIVSKIEELFSELDQAVAQLKTAQQQLKVYRQALLKQAFEGKLTETWRAKHQPEPASRLLERIKAEREARHQHALRDWKVAVTQWEASGKQGKKPGKPKAPKALPPLTKEELAKLPRVPANWSYIQLGLIGQLDRGKSKHRPRNDPRLFGGEYPFIQTGEIRNSKVVVSEYSNTYSEFGLQQSRLWKKGTLCITIAANIAETAFLGFNACFPDSVVGFQPEESVSSKFVYYFIQNSRAQIEEYAPATAQKNINLNILDNIAVPLCNSQEQLRIVEELDLSFSVIDNVEGSVSHSLDEAETLRQSILKKAFEGRLVPQDPTDEPASELLKRIREEKEVYLKGQKAKRALRAV